jgi:phage terminase large subunit GpA-like protein
MMQHWEWKNVRFDKENPDIVSIGCVECDFEFHEQDKRRAVQLGAWIPTAEKSKTAGFHINELYSSWRTWQEVVIDFLEAKKSPETLKTWVNTSLGETWEETGDSADDESLHGRREIYSSEVPENVVLLTAGIDTQDDRLEMTVIGWDGRNGVEESWVISHDVIWGSPGRAEVWQQLDDLLLKSYKKENGDMLKIASSCIDSGGHFTQNVYDFVKPRQGRGVYAIKGMAGEGRPVVSAPYKKRSGKNKLPVELFTIGVDVAKGLILSRLKTTEIGTGYIHFCETLDEEYFKQLTAEKRVTRFHKGFPRREWLKTRKRNEALDCMVYGLGALAILNPVWEVIAKRIETRDESRHGSPKPRRISRQRKRSNYASGWK